MGGAGVEGEPDPARAREFKAGFLGLQGSSSGGRVFWAREQGEQGHWKEKEAEGTQQLCHLQGFRGWEPRVQREMLIDEL